MTDFQNSFTDKFNGKFPAKSSLTNNYPTTL